MKVVKRKYVFPLLTVAILLILYWTKESFVRFVSPFRYYNRNQSLSQNLRDQQDKNNIAMKIRERETMLQEILEYNKEHESESKKRLPKVVGIGVKKCGTHAINAFLAHHPMIKFAPQVETFYFSSHYKKGIEFYKNLFPPINYKQKAMEKTPAYFTHPPDKLPEMIKKSLPGVKLLLVVCDPTPRVLSDFTQEKVREKLFHIKYMEKFATLDEYLDEYLPRLEKLLNESNQRTEDPLQSLQLQRRLSLYHKEDVAGTILSTGLYFYHFQRWKRSFSNSDLMIIDGEELLENPGPIMENIQDFIGLPKILLREDFVKHPETGFFCYKKATEKSLNEFLTLNQELVNSLECLGAGKGRSRKGKRTMSISASKRLQRFYAPYNKAFFNDINKNLNWT